MTDPFTAAALLAVSTAATISAGQTAAKQGKFQAEIARQQAERQEQLTALEVAKVRRDVSRSLGAQRARFAASGIDPSAGSALLLTEEGAGEGELQARLTNAQGLGRAAQFRQDAALSLFKGRAAQQQSFFKAGTGLLEGAPTIRNFVNALSED